MMTLMSCERDHLYYQTVSRGKVQFDIDWSKTNFAPESKGYDEDNKLNGVTIFAFDSATHKLVKELPPDANWQSPVVRLAPGTYDMILINDSREELPSIRFDMESPFEEFSAYTHADTVYADQPEYLAVSAVRNVSFHPEKTEYYHDMPEGYYRDYIAQKISTVQKAVTKRINVKVYVKGMNYCKGMQRSYITGLAKSVNLVTRQPSKEEAVYGFNLVNRDFQLASGGSTVTSLCVAESKAKMVTPFSLLSSSYPLLSGAKSVLLQSMSNCTLSLLTVW